MDPETIVHDSSGNIFQGLGMVDADERLAKAGLARTIRKTIRDRGLAEDDVVRKLGLEPEEVRDLIRGRLARFSRPRLTRLAAQALE